MKKAFRFYWWFGMGLCGIGLYFLYQVLAKLHDIIAQHSQSALSLNSEAIADFLVKLDGGINPIIFDVYFVFFFFLLGLSSFWRSELLHLNSPKDKEILD